MSTTTYWNVDKAYEIQHEVNVWREPNREHVTVTFRFPIEIFRGLDEKMLWSAYREAINSKIIEGV